MKPNLITRKLRYGLGASQTVHFSAALPEFIKSQVLHFHPSLSEGGLSPAAPQLNPPDPFPVVVVVVVVEGTGPNPVKAGLDVDPTGLGAANKNPDAVDVGGVELDAPNWSGPEGGVGMEKAFPEPEPEEDTPGLGTSQTVQFSLADAGFVKPRVSHFHPSVFVVGGFNPAAPQLNLPEPEFVDVVAEVPPGPKTRGVEGGFGMDNDGVVDGFSAPGFGVSHTVHFSVADAGFIKSQAPHFQPSVSVEGGFSPAAPQLNPPVPEPVVPNEGGRKEDFGRENEEVASGLTTPDLGVSHTVHFSVADAGFVNSQVPHFHPSSGFGGGFEPAAPQLNPPFVTGAVVAVEGVGKVVNAEVEVWRVLVLVLGPALLGLDGPAEVEERSQPSSIGTSSSANPLTSFSALNSQELFPSLKVLLGSIKVSVGSSETVIERTSALASLGEVAAVGDTEEAEEAVSSLSGLILNRSFEGSLGAEDLRPKKDLPLVVGETVGPDDEAPLRPAVCNWGVSPGSMTSEGRRNRLDCEGGGRSSISTIVGSEGVGPFFCFFGDGSSSSSSTSSMVAALDPLRLVDDPF